VWLGASFLGVIPASPGYFYYIPEDQHIPFRNPEKLVSFAVVVPYTIIFDHNFVMSVTGKSSV
jgi:hypothetical protein